MRVTGDRPTGNLNAHGGKPTSASGLTPLEGPLTMWTNGLSSANQQAGVPVGDLEYDLSIPLGSEGSGWDGRDIAGDRGNRLHGTGWPSRVPSEGEVERVV